MRLIGRIVLWFFALIGMTAASAVAVGIVFAVFYHDNEPVMPERVVLWLDLDGGVADTQSEAPWASFLDENTLTLRSVVTALEDASRDDRVAGVAVRLGAAPIGIAAAQELRQAFLELRKQDKFAVGFSPSFDGSENMMALYMLAASFDRVSMQPSGSLALTGISIEMPFAREALDKVGIKPEFEQRHEYKSAVETFTRSGLSDPARQSLELVVDSWMRQILNSISSDRNLPVGRLRDIVDRAPLLATEAQESGLIDALEYGEDFQAVVLARAGADAAFMNLLEYADFAEPPQDSLANVALIYGSGPIVAGKSGDEFLSDDQFSAASIAGTIGDAADDPEIGAIVLRIDSPGGGYVASDTLRSAILRAREKGKVVIASMGATAASGGYFVAMGADKIIAQPGTLTGSIGVFGGKFVTTELWDKLGINWAKVSVGANAGMWSPMRPFSEGAAGRHRAVMDSIYQDFTGKAGADRNISDSGIDAVARGRVWTGEDARRVGLVDELGGVSAALDAVREMLALQEDAILNVIVMPARQSPFEHLLEFLDVNGSISHAVAGVVRSMKGDSYRSLRHQLGPIMKDIELLRPPTGVLQFPQFRIVP